MSEICCDVGILANFCPNDVQITCYVFSDPPPENLLNVNILCRFGPQNLLGVGILCESYPNHIAQLVQMMSRLPSVRLVPALGYPFILASETLRAPVVLIRFPVSTCVPGF